MSLVEKRRAQWSMSWVSQPFISRGEVFWENPRTGANYRCGMLLPLALCGWLTSLYDLLVALQVSFFLACYATKWGSDLRSESMDIPKILVNRKFMFDFIDRDLVHVWDDLSWDPGVSSLRLHLSSDEVGSRTRDLPGMGESAAAIMLEMSSTCPGYFVAELV